MKLPRSLCYLLAIVVCGAGLAITWPAAAHAHKQQSIPQLVHEAESAHAITPAQRRDYLHVWRASARALKTLHNRGQSSRRNEVIDIRNITTSLAHSGKLTPQRMEAVFANVNATTWVFLHHAYPKYAQRIQVPGDAAIFGFYPNQGMQFQPLFSFVQANKYAARKSTVKLLALMTRMQQLAVHRDGYVAWEYYFNWEGGHPPWVSAMAEATAAQALARTTALTGDTQWLDLAHQIIPGFGRSARRGGLMSYANGGRWYLLYAFAPAQRILNGHLQTLLGLHDYVAATNDSRAAAFLQQGINAALPALANYDTGAWSEYQPGEEANLNYHDLMTTQLKKLGRYTGLAQFTDLGAKFAEYRTQPPTVTVVQTPPAAAYPQPRDGFRDSVTIGYSVDKLSRVTLQIRSLATQKIVRTVRLYNIGRGSHTYAWDGTDAHGDPVPAGTYDADVSARGPAGNESTPITSGPLTIAVDTTPPKLLKIRIEKTRKGDTLLRVRGYDALSPWVTLQIIGVHPKRVVDRVKLRIGHTETVHLNVPYAQVAAGFARVVDTSGNRHTYRVRSIFIKR